MTDSQRETPGAESNVSIMDLIRVVYQWRTMVLTLTIGLTLITAVIMLFVPNSYTARGTILLEISESPLNLEFLGQLGSLAGLGQSSSTAEIYLAILHSRRVKEAVIDSLELSTYYEVEGDSPDQIMESTIFALNKNVKFDAPDQVTMTISAKDTDPKMAAEITNVFLDRLADANTTLSLSRSHRTRKLIEEALELTQSELESARIRLGEFQTQYGVFSLDDQTKGTLALIGQLQSQLLEAQIQRDALGGVLRDNSSGVRSLDLTISALQSQIHKLVGKTETGEESQAGKAPAVESSGIDDGDSDRQSSGEDNPGFILPLGKVPDLTGDYARIMMDLKVLETKYSVLATQLEKTKIDESQSVPSFEILDRAEVPYTKTSPNRKLYVLSAFAIGLMAGVLLAILLTDLSRRVDADTRMELRSMLPRPLARLFGEHAVERPSSRNGIGE